MGGSDRNRESERGKERRKKREMTEMNSYYPAGGEGNEGISDESATNCWEKEMLDKY